MNGLIERMTANFPAGESRLRDHQIRPSRNQPTIATVNEAACAQNVAFDDRLQAAGGIAPFLCNALAAIDHGGDLTACGAGTLAVKRDERIAQFDALNAPRTIVCGTSSEPVNQLRKCYQRRDIAIDVPKAIDDNANVDWSGKHQRSGDLQDNVRVCYLQDQMLAVEGVEVQMSDERQLANVEFKICCPPSCIDGKPAMKRRIGPDDRSVGCGLVGSRERTTGPRPPPEAGGGGTETRARMLRQEPAMSSDSHTGVPQVCRSRTYARIPKPNLGLPTLRDTRTNPATLARVDLL